MRPAVSPIATSICVLRLSFFFFFFSLKMTYCASTFSPFPPPATVGAFSRSPNKNNPIAYFSFYMLSRVIRNYRYAGLSGFLNLFLPSCSIVVPPPAARAISFLIISCDFLSFSDFECQGPVGSEPTSNRFLPQTPSRCTGFSNLSSDRPEETSPDLFFVEVFCCRSVNPCRSPTVVPGATVLPISLHRGPRWL